MIKPVLYASPSSYYSAKVRAYLNWKSLDFDEVQATPDIMQTVIIPAIGRPIIPVLRLPDGTFVQDTFDIIQNVEGQFPSPSVMPPNGLQKFVSLILQLYGDEWLLLAAMHYRWAYNEEWIYAEFGRNAAPEQTANEQYAIGRQRGEAFKGVVPALGISEETIPGIERSCKAFLSDFSAHLEIHPFIFGDQPTLADFSFFGPLYAHLYRDPASGEMMRNVAPKVVEWICRILDPESQASKTQQSYDVPQSLYPILRRSLSEHLPVLLATNERLNTWAEKNAPNKELPRSFEPVAFSMGGCSGNTMSRPFSLYRLQHALDAYHAMSASEKMEADKLLSEIDGEELKHFTVSRRLERKNYKLVLKN